MKNSVSRGASSQNRTSVPTRSAAFGPHRQPSAAIGSLWVGVKRGYGSPPQTPPDFLFVIYKVEVVGVVYCSHTPEGVGGFLADLQPYKDVACIYKRVTSRVQAGCKRCERRTCGASLLSALAYLLCSGQNIVSKPTPTTPLHHTHAAYIAYSPLAPCL